MVHGGQRFVTFELASRLLIEAKGGRLLALRHAKPQASLSSREQQLLERVSRGPTNREIAEQLGVKATTIKSYLTQAFKKLKVTNRLRASKSSRE